MHSLLIPYAQARQLEIEHEISQRHNVEHSSSVRDRVGRALISLGEHLVTVPPAGHQVARPAA